MTKHVHNYCYICGSSVQALSGNSWNCPECDTVFYENPRACAEIALFNDRGEVLLVQRAREPWKGKYDLTGGFVQGGETAQAAMLRELHEEVGIQRHNISKPQFVTTWAAKYPWGVEIYDALTTTFTAHINNDAPLRAGDDASAYVFIHPDHLTEDMFSIPEYLHLIKKAEKRLNS